MRPLLAAVVASSLWACPGQPELANPPDPVQAPVLPRVSVLFVGNSLTDVNDLPGTVVAFSSASPFRGTLSARSVTRGGAPLSEHWRKGEVVSALRLHRPDVLVLQGQSAEPLVSPGEFARHIRLFKAAADAVGTRTILFATWARPVGDSFYQDAVSGGSPERMQALLNGAYESLSTELRIQCAPVGRAFSLSRRLHPEYRLLDGTQHPTVEGTYLAAAVIFQAIYRCGADVSSFSGSIPEKTAEALRHIAALLANNPGLA